MALNTERLVLLLLFIAAALAITLYNADVFLHLTTGRYLLEHNAFPEGDPFSFSHSGAPWNLHEWLYQVGLYALYAQFGETGIKFATALLFVLTVDLTKRNCELVGAHRNTAWVVTLLGVVAWTNFLSARPHMLSFLFFAFTLNAILQYRKNGEVGKLYLIPVVMLFWVNVHGAFLLGIALLGYFLIIQAIENRISGLADRPLSPIFYTVIFSLLMTLVNPNGFEQLLFPFQLANQWAIEYVAEWQPPDFSQPIAVVYLLMVAALIVFSLVRSNRVLMSGLIITIPFVAASLTSMRHIPIAVIFLTPFLTRAIEHVLALIRQHSLKRKVDGGRTSSPISRTLHRELGQSEYLMNWSILALSVVLLIWLWPKVTVLKKTMNIEQFPVDAVQYLDRNGITGRMFSPMGYSDYILFERYPRQKIFYDMRVEIYGGSLAKDYLLMLYAKDGWKRKFKQYHFDFAVLRLSDPLFGALLEKDLGEVVYRDKRDAIVLFDNKMITTN